MPEHVHYRCPQLPALCCICAGHDHSGMPVDYVRSTGSPELSRSERGLAGDVENAVEPETLPVADAPCSERIDDYLRAIRELRDEGVACRSVGADAALANAQGYLGLAIACVRRAAKHERVHEVLGAGALV